MERKVIPETENRLVILYALGRLGPVTGMQLLEYMVELDLMNYITLQLSLGELEAQRQVARRAHPCGELWELTEEGRFALESFQRRIPHSRRERMDQAAMGCQPRFKQEQLAPADAVTLPDGTACVRLRLLEERAAMMDVMLYMPGPQVPTMLEQRWHACAQEAYEAVMAALTEGYDPSAPMPEIPERVLRQADAGEWLLSLTDREEKPTLSLLLPLPGEHLARWCAARWPEACAGLRSLLIGHLARGGSSGSV